jgi:hypothetical protein
MKFSHLLFLFLILIGLSSSCNPDNEEVLFELEFEENFNIDPGLSPFLVYYFELRDISTFWDQQLQVNNFSDADIDEVKPSRLRIASLYHEEELDFIEEIEVFVYTDNEANKTDVAYSINVPRNTKYEINLAPALPNLKGYFSEDKVNIQIKMRLRESTTRQSTCRMTLELKAVKRN